MAHLVRILVRDDMNSSTTALQFDSSQDKRGSIICASVIAAVLAILSTVLRVIARRIVGAPLKADDWWIFFGCFMAINVVISTFEMVHSGLGLHIDQVVSAEGLAKSVLASQVFYSTSIPTIKISILCLYHRLFPSRNLRNVSIGIGSVVVLYSLVQVICMLTQCIPLSAIWDPDSEAFCWDINAVYITVAVLNVITDIAILCLPIKYVLALKVSNARKIQVLSIFFLGSCVCAFGIVRAVVVGTASIHDISFNDVGSAIWSVVEICVGVVSANLPCFRPLMKKLPKALGGSTQPTHPSGAYGGGRNARRLSKGPAGIEMAGRRPKSGFGGWRNIEGDDDGRPFARETTVLSPEHSRSASRVEAAQRGDGDGDTKGAYGVIVVETTIEVTETRREDQVRTGSQDASSASSLQ